MENTRDKYKALLASLGVHLIIFFIAAAVGVFSMATLKEKSDNVEVVIHRVSCVMNHDLVGHAPRSELVVVDVQIGLYDRDAFHVIFLLSH